MLNRRGHIPTLLLLVCGIILIGVAWFTFLQFDGSLNSRAIDFSRLIENVSYQEEYVNALLPLIVERSVENSDVDRVEGFEARFNEQFKERARQVQSISDFDDEFFNKIINGEYTLLNDGEVYEVRMDDFIIRASGGRHEITRYVDLMVRFDARGVS